MISPVSNQDFVSVKVMRAAELSIWSLFLGERSLVYFGGFANLLLPLLLKIVSVLRFLRVAVA